MRRPSPPGERLFGYLPMASHVLLTPEVPGPPASSTPTPHRVELLVRTTRIAGWGLRWTDDGRELVLRPLHMLCFLLADQLEAEGRPRRRPGAPHQRVVGRRRSAWRSSSGAPARAWPGSRRPATPASCARRASMTRSRPTTSLETLDAGRRPRSRSTWPGTARCAARIHEHFGSALRSSILVGATHVASRLVRVRSDAPGAAPGVLLRTRTVEASARASGAPRSSRRGCRTPSRRSRSGRRGGCGSPRARAPAPCWPPDGRVLGGETPPDVAEVVTLSAARAA